MRADSRWTVDRVAIDVCCRAIPGRSAVRRESLQSRRDARGRPGARVVGARRSLRPSLSCECDFTVNGVAGRVTPYGRSEAIVPARRPGAFLHAPRIDDDLDLA